MTNNNSTSNFVFSASERELLTRSLPEIINGLMADYKSFSKGIEEGIRIPDSKLEARMSHSCILYAEGLRLAYSHLELAKKLILASLFDFTVQANHWLKMEKEAKQQIDLLEEIERFNHYTSRAVAWLTAYGEGEQVKNLLKDIKDFEDWKAEERRKEEERKKKEEEERLRLLGKIK